MTFGEAKMAESARCWKEALSVIGNVISNVRFKRNRSFQVDKKEEEIDVLGTEDESSNFILAECTLSLRNIAKLALFRRKCRKFTKNKNSEFANIKIFVFTLRVCDEDTKTFALDKEIKIVHPK
ncbi:hypothetical protein M3Y94_00384800 [Aphelenchoides besseyi]|nr:hypothetical protein M3Y94_00384800 [Aphelenchoides besseyi]